MKSGEEAEAEAEARSHARAGRSRHRAGAMWVVTAFCISLGCCRSPLTPSSASGRTPPPSVALSVVSGETGSPVSGARVVIGGENLVSDQAGRVASPLGTADGVFVDVVASGFLDRQTVLRPSEPQITLWPTTSPRGLDPDFSSTLVYSPGACPAQNSPSQPLRRFAATTAAAVVIFAEGFRDQAAQTTHSEAISRLNASTGGAPNYSFSTTTPSSGVVFTVQIDPGGAACTASSEPLRASTTLILNNGLIIGGTLTFCTLAAARALDLVLHELGHTYGLFHSSSLRDVMWCASGRPSDFSARETLAMGLMRQRRGGNRWPDNDRSANAILGLREETVSCGAR